jgi:hypothetical protein
MTRGAAGAFLALAALAGTAAAQMPMQQMPPDPKFAGVVANEIHAVVAFMPPDFTLALRENETRFAFYGKEAGKYEAVRCERQTAFEFVAAANLVGNIQAGICASEARRIRTLAATAPSGLTAMLQQVPEIDMEQRRKAGLTTTRTEGHNRTEEHAFPVMAFGHGMSVAQTVVIVAAGARQAVVVQANLHNLCESYGLKDKTALCRDTRQALLDIARRLQTRFARP